jgi:hypothetical protein
VTQHYNLSIFGGFRANLMLSRDQRAAPTIQIATSAPAAAAGGQSAATGSAIPLERHKPA